MRIIPAIDIIEGKCVRLSQGDYRTKKIYNINPLEVARKFEDHGIKYLHLVDLDGARSRHIVNYKILEQIASKTSLKIDFGGGIKTDEDLKIAFECGAKQITGGSVAVKNPQIFESWVKYYGAEKIILGADALNEKIAINGWNEDSNLDLVSFVSEYFKKGVKTVICTDISKDGMLKGPSVPLYQKLISSIPGINLIASGGISNLKDLHLLDEIGCEASILGKALYEGRIGLKQLEVFN